MTFEEINEAQQRLTTFIREDKKISAIKEIRTLTGGGLRESKAVLDALMMVPLRTVEAHAVTHYTAVQEQNAHYVVISEYPDDTSVTHFRDDGAWSSISEAMSYAKGKVDVVNDVMVAKVIAATKRTLVTL
jgi:hypothetical protein